MDAGTPRSLAASLGVLVLAGGVYLNALHNPFVYDDHHLVVANASIQHVANLRAIVLHDVTRPVVSLSYACLLYTSPSPRDRQKSRMPSSA